jgi:hypothetical protein
MPEERSSISQLVKDIYPFSDLDEENLQIALPYLERVRIPAGTTIFTTDGSADYFYFILSGKVDIEISYKEQFELLQRLEPYDHFGEDALAGHTYHTRAIAKTNCYLIRMSRMGIERVCDESSIIKRIFRIFSRTYKNYCRLNFSWRQPGETYYIVSRHHPFFLIMRLVPILLISMAIFAWFLYKAFLAAKHPMIWLVLALMVLLIGLMGEIWELLGWLNEYFILTKDRVLMQKLVIGLFESRQETPMNAVLSSELTSSFFGRLIGYGIVTAKAYTGNMQIKRIPDPDLMSSYLEYRRRCILSEQNRKEKEAMHTMLNSRLHPERTNPVPVPAEPELPAKVNYYTGSFSDILARFFSLRQEKEGAVIYHTHWWILVKKLFLPSLLLLLVLLAAFGRFFGLITAPSTQVYIACIVLAIVGWAWWLYQFSDWRNDVYIISKDQLVDLNQRPLGTEDRRTAPIKNIQTVEYVRNGIIGMALNFGTVKIKIGTEELTFDNVYNPSAVQIEIFNRFHEITENSHKMEQRRMTEWFSTYDGMREGNENRH